MDTLSSKLVAQANLSAEKLSVLLLRQLPLSARLLRVLLRSLQCNGAHHRAILLETALQAQHWRQAGGASNAGTTGGGGKNAGIPLMNTQRHQQSELSTKDGGESAKSNSSSSPLEKEKQRRQSAALQDMDMVDEDGNGGRGDDDREGSDSSSKHAANRPKDSAPSSHGGFISGGSGGGAATGTPPPQGADALEDPFIAALLYATLMHTPLAVPIADAVPEFAFITTVAELHEPYYLSKHARAAGFPVDDPDAITLLLQQGQRAKEQDDCLDNKDKSGGGKKKKDIKSKNSGNGKKEQKKKKAQAAPTDPRGNLSSSSALSIPTFLDLVLARNPNAAAHMAASMAAARGSEFESIIQAFGGALRLVTRDDEIAREHLLQRSSLCHHYNVPSKKADNLRSNMNNNGAAPFSPVSQREMIDQLAARFGKSAAVYAEMCVPALTEVLRREVWDFNLRHTRNQLNEPETVAAWWRMMASCNRTADVEALLQQYPQLLRFLARDPNAPRLHASCAFGKQQNSANNNNSSGGGHQLNAVLDPKSYARVLQALLASPISAPHVLVPQMDFAFLEKHFLDILDGAPREGARERAFEALMMTDFLKKQHVTKTANHHAWSKYAFHPLFNGNYNNSNNNIKSESSATMLGGDPFWMLLGGCASAAPHDIHGVLDLFGASGLHSLEYLLASPTAALNNDFTSTSTTASGGQKKHQKKKSAGTSKIQATSVKEGFCIRDDLWRARAQAAAGVTSVQEVGLLPETMHRLNAILGSRPLPTVQFLVPQLSFVSAASMRARLFSSVDTSTSSFGVASGSAGALAGKQVSTTASFGGDENNNTDGLLVTKPMPATAATAARAVVAPPVPSSPLQNNVCALACDYTWNMARAGPATMVLTAVHEGLAQSLSFPGAVDSWACIGASKNINTHSTSTTPHEGVEVDEEIDTAGVEVEEETNTATSLSTLVAAAKAKHSAASNALKAFLGRTVFHDFRRLLHQDHVAQSNVGLLAAFVGVAGALDHAKAMGFVHREYTQLLASQQMIVRRIHHGAEMAMAKSIDEAREEEASERAMHSVTEAMHRGRGDAANADNNDKATDQEGRMPLSGNGHTAAFRHYDTMNNAHIFAEYSPMQEEERVRQRLADLAAIYSPSRPESFYQSESAERSLFEAARSELAQKATAKQHQQEKEEGASPDPLSRGGEQQRHEQPILSSFHNKASKAQGGPLSNHRAPGVRGSDTENSSSKQMSLLLDNPVHYTRYNPPVAPVALNINVICAVEAADAYAACIHASGKSTTAGSTTDVDDHSMSESSQVEGDIPVAGKGGAASTTTATSTAAIEEDVIFPPRQTVTLRPSASTPMIAAAGRNIPALPPPRQQPQQTDAKPPHAKQQQQPPRAAASSAQPATSEVIHLLGGRLAVAATTSNTSNTSNASSALCEEEGKEVASYMREVASPRLLTTCAVRPWLPTSHGWAPAIRHVLEEHFDTVVAASPPPSSSLSSARANNNTSATMHKNAQIAMSYTAAELRDLAVVAASASPSSSAATTATASTPTPAADVKKKSKDKKKGGDDEVVADVATTTTTTGSKDESAAEGAAAAASMVPARLLMPLRHYGALQWRRLAQDSSVY